ncbi:MAG: RsmD family RNA methyltransferase [Verrucomicrobiae bacterium]|nr:RsmD family RNA methyltransferase [Verrucomicrobiae bacterium]
MRIIAGSAGGVPLFAPKDLSVRPAADRTRAALFSALGDRVPGAKVLDLFAGTGSIGLEAISRGAASCVFVEKHKMSVKLLERNMAKTRLTGPIMAVDAIFALGQLVARGERFDIVVADPPFWKETDVSQNILSNRELRKYSTELLHHPDLRTLMAPGGIFVLDSYHLDRFEVPREWELVREREYGQVRVQFLVLKEG